MHKHLRMILYITLVFGMLVLFTHLMTAEQAPTLSELEFVTWDDVLYSPEELHALSAEEESKGHVGWDYDYYDTDFSRVRTNRILLRLTPGETYGLYTEQLTYAAKLWVDGRLMVESGRVSPSPEGFVPRTGSTVVYFTAQDETEIVMQRCNFCHAKWNAVLFYLGPQPVITRQVEVRFFSQILYLGFLTGLGVLNLGMFMGMPDRKKYLWFCLCCFGTLVHQSLQDPKMIMTVLPRLNWYVSYKTENISLFHLIIFLILFLRDCFGSGRWPWAEHVILGLLGTLCLLTAVMPTAFFTQYTVQTAVAVASLVMIYLGLLLINVVRSWKNLITSQRYYLAGIALFLIAALLAFLRIGPAHVNLLMIGLILFETVITLALAMEFLDLQKAYIQSRTNEDHLKSLNTAMEQTQTMQENFITIMNHEMRTPLTVIAGYADLTARRMALQDPKDEEMIRNLRLIKSEALRLGRIVKNTDEGVRSILSAGTEETADVRRLLEDARDFCRPICDKNGNAIIIDCPSQVKVPCVRDNVLQALYNLILNASRHTRKGLIRLICRESGNEIILKVADNGDGMDEETKKHAFERGYSGDGGHGLGLTLCSEVAQRHHGRIWIENNQEGGTTVCLALPWAKQHKP